MKKKVAIVSFSEIKIDPRVRRQIDLLKNDYDLTIFGHGALSIEGVKFHSIPIKKNSIVFKIIKCLKLLFRFYESVYWNDFKKDRLLAVAKNQQFDVVIANDVEALPVSLEIGSPVILDAHEYSPLELENRLVWKILFSPYVDYLCRNYLSKAKTRFTVCSSIAELYESEYGCKFEVVYNAPFYTEQSPSVTDGETIRMIHHGATIRDRKLENMLYLMDLLPSNYTLDLMLVSSDSDYLNFLKEESKSRRVRFLDPVPTEEIAFKINEYDIGLYFLEPLNLNQKYALPNKIFEFIQARLCLVVGPSIEMVNVVKSFDVGRVASDFSIEAVASALKSLNAEMINNYKANTAKASSELSFEKQGHKLVESLREVIVSE